MPLSCIVWQHLLLIGLPSFKCFLKLALCLWESSVWVDSFWKTFRLIN